MESINLVTMILVALAIADGVMRVLGFKSQAYQAFSHLFVGGLIVAWLLTRGQLYLLLWVALCVVEGVCFLRSRG